MELKKGPIFTARGMESDCFTDMTRSRYCCSTCAVDTFGSVGMKWTFNSRASAPASSISLPYLIQPPFEGPLRRPITGIERELLALLTRAREGRGPGA